MSGVREICTASFETATAWALLPPHRTTGRFQPPLGRPKDYGVSTDAKLLAHYAVADGPLYRDRRCWRQGYNFVRAFTSKSRMHRAAYRMTVAPFVGPLPDVQPLDLFDQLCSLLFAAGLSLRDRNDVVFQAVAHITDGCQVMDLPEPYGKWLQLEKRRPRWSSRLELELEVRLSVASRRSDQEGGGYAAHCDAVVTAPAISLLQEVQDNAGRLFGVPTPPIAPQPALRAALSDVMDKW